MDDANRPRPRSLLQRSNSTASKTGTSSSTRPMSARTRPNSLQDQGAVSSSSSSSSSTSSDSTSSRRYPPSSSRAAKATSPTEPIARSSHLRSLSNSSVSKSSLQRPSSSSSSSSTRLSTGNRPPSQDGTSSTTSAQRQHRRNASSTSTARPPSSSSHHSSDAATPAKAMARPLSSQYHARTPSKSEPSYGKVSCAAASSSNLSLMSTPRQQVPSSQFHHLSSNTLFASASPSKSSPLKSPYKSAEPQLSSSMAGASAFQQNELLFFHLLHRQAPTTLSSWHESAQATLSEQFHQLANLHRDLTQGEAKCWEAENIMEWKAWLTLDTPSEQDSYPAVSTLQDALLFLSRILAFTPREGTEIVNHASVNHTGNSLYDTLCSQFEKWYLRWEELQAVRSGEASTKDTIFTLLPSIDDTASSHSHVSWREQTEGIIGQLEILENRLNKVPLPPHALDCVDDVDIVDGNPTKPLIEEDTKQSIRQPVLPRTIAACMTLVSGMAEELRLMRSMEAHIGSIEKEWVRRMATTGGEGPHEGEKGGAGAIWRIF